MLPPEVGIHLHVLNRTLEAKAYEAVVAAGFDDVTIAQARLLARVGDAGTRLVELADRARVTKQTAGHLVDQLERTGYVERVRDPTDGRARLVCLTAKARRAVPVAGEEVGRVLAEWSAVLGPDLSVHLTEALERLGALNDPFRDR